MSKNSEDLQPGLRQHYAAKDERAQKWVRRPKLDGHNDPVMKDAPTQRPDIKYLPSKDTFERRRQRLAANKKASTT